MHEGFWIPTSNQWTGPFQKKWIICHGTAGGTSAQGIASYFKSTEGTTNPVSSNYVIGQDGTIVSLVDEEDAAWANGILSAGCDPWWVSKENPNIHTISIEHCKPDDANATPLTHQQQDASFGLIARLCQRHNIPRRRADAAGGITGHYSIDPVNRSRCPGNFPWTDLFDYLQGKSGMLSLNDPWVANYYVQAPGNAWRCLHTGCVVGNAMLDYYRSFETMLGENALAVIGLPMTDEQALASQYPGCVAQKFERALLVYDPARVVDQPPGAKGSVYFGHIP